MMLELVVVRTLALIISVLNPSPGPCLSQTPTIIPHRPGVHPLDDISYYSPQFFVHVRGGVAEISSGVLYCSEADLIHRTLEVKR